MLVVPLQFCCWLYANFQANNIINTVIINIPQSLQWNWGVFFFRLCIQHISQKVLWNHETCTERMLNLKSDINPLWKSSLTFLLIPLVGLVFVFLFVVSDVDWTPSHEQSKTRVPPNLPQPLQCQQHSAVDSSQTQCLPRWVVYTTDTRVWMRKCCYVRSGYPVSWARGSWSIHSTTQILAGKLIFVEGRKLRNPEKHPWSQIEINQSQPTYKPRIEPGLQWWEVLMMTTAPTYMYCNSHIHPKFCNNCAIIVC